MVNSETKESKASQDKGQIVPLRSVYTGKYTDADIEAAIAAYKPFYDEDKAERCKMLSEFMQKCEYGCINISDIRG